ncbi:hypothetical protein QBC37DRAFT_442535 [Rhypophila decipiens]|uniref:Uncharacterized protein n=1 Tax=Rhypophila decipiens TaxID=261697 RepID=A0AAN6Y208_9PEZI|nr:hypothetical protein QBC37DRAFT_442535 [Rhypophila decipiens]
MEALLGSWVSNLCASQLTNHNGKHVQAGDLPDPKRPTDEVLVAHALDDARALRDIIMGLAFRFDHVLDCDKILDALARLLEVGGWRRLGGRLRLNKKTGRIEIHVPKKFTPDRPAVRYSHVTFDMNMDQHPQLRDHFPHPTEGPSMQSGFQEYLQSDHPQISLHVVSFRDATLVAVKIPHFSTDIIGWHHLLHNWSLVLSGLEDEVQPFGGFNEDITERIAHLSIPDKPSEKLSSPDIELAGHKQLTGLGMFLFVLRFLWAILFGPRVTSRTVFLPAKTMQILREETRRDLETHVQQCSSSQKITPSDADMLTAWTAKMTLTSTSREIPNKMSQTASIMTVVDMRKRCPSIFSPPDDNGQVPVYIQNLSSVAMTHLPVKALLSQPLGITASQIRRSVTPQASEEVISGVVRHVLADVPGRLRTGTTLFAKGTEILFPTSNWTCARLFEFDLGPAVIGHTGNKPGSSNARPGRPMTIAPVVFSTNPVIRNTWTVTGRDAQGNYWLQAVSGDETWAVVGRELERLKAAVALI